VIDFAVHLGIYVGIWAVLAVSLNLQYGFTGLVNFGQVLFFAIGAYAVAVGHEHHVPVWGEVGLAMVGAGLAAWCISMPVRRMAPDYWALVTFGAGEIFRLIMLNERSIAAGSIGVGGISSTAQPWQYLALVVALFGVAFALAERVSHTPFGRVLRVIREDELLAASLGKPVYVFQLEILILSGVLAALAGVLYAHYVTYVSPDQFMAIETFVVWAAIILGGIGNNLGVVVGAAVIEGISQSTRFIAQLTGVGAERVADLRIILVGVLLVLLVMFRPYGVLPEGKRELRAGGFEAE
jgi:branched-chain amino acid transport system permease protein